MVMEYEIRQFCNCTCVKIKKKKNYKLKLLKIKYIMYFKIITKSIIIIPIGKIKNRRYLINKDLELTSFKD